MLLGTFVVVPFARGGANGACCVFTGDCIPNVPAEVCIDGLFGVFQGDGSDCSTETCIPFGPCCFPDITCLPMTIAEECMELGGAFQGPGIGCPVTCPLVGACCMDDGSCSIFTAIDCEANGGLYRGFLTTCADVVCTGACVVDNRGACTDNQTPAACSLSDGAYQGNGSTCAEVSPPSLVQRKVVAFDQNYADTRRFDKFDDFGGTRILQTVRIDIDASIHAVVLQQNFSSTDVIPIVDVMELLTAEIENVSGQILLIALDGLIDCGPGFVLPPGESCDFGSPLSYSGAVQTSPSNLDDFIGTGETFDVRLWGEGGFAQGGVVNFITQLHRVEAEMTVTYEYAVTGACCFADEVCRETIESDCMGVYQGVRTTCANIECPQACCLPDGSCRFIPVSDCVFRDGTPYGEGSTCRVADCPVVSCGCDVDSDGNCGFADLLVIISSWDSANPLADLDGNGVVGFQDLLILISGWGECGEPLRRSP